MSIIFLWLTGWWESRGLEKNHSADNASHCGTDLCYMTIMNSRRKLIMTNHNPATKSKGRSLHLSPFACSCFVWLASYSSSRLEQLSAIDSGFENAEHLQTKQIKPETAASATRQQPTKVCQCQATPPTILVLCLPLVAFDWSHLQRTIGIRISSGIEGFHSILGAIIFQAIHLRSIPTLYIHNLAQNCSVRKDVRLN